MNTYSITVNTSNKKNAGTNANVYIELIGKKGTSGMVYLKTSKTNKDKFEQGQNDLFEVNCPDVGILKLIRIGHDNSGFSSGWHLKDVLVESISNGRKWVCVCDRWLAKDEDDRKIERELVAVQVDDDMNLNKSNQIWSSNKSLRLNNDNFDRQYGSCMYKIYVKTSDKLGAGTDANVYIQLFGRKLFTDKIELKTSGLHKNAFEQGKTDYFEINSLDVGKIERIKIGHNNKGLNAGWHLSQVVIEKEDGSTFTFPCNKWLDKKEGSGLIERELFSADGGLQPKPYDSYRRDECLYKVWVKTSDKISAGTDADVYIQIFGKKLNTEKIELKKSNSHKNKFEAGKTDLFELKDLDVGKIKKIKVGHNNKGIGAGWHLAEVVIEKENDAKYVFPCNQWLDKKEGDGLIERELFPLDIDNSTNQNIDSCFYRISVKTSDKVSAGTDADVFIQIFGKKLYTEKIELKNSNSHKNKFEAGKTDVFELKQSDVGKIKKIKIGHNNKGMGPGWHLAEVVIEKENDAKYVFPCNQWLDKKEGDGLIERELFPLDIDNSTNNGSCFYRITVKTSDVPSAGTDANVFIQIFGKFSYSDKMLLKSSSLHRNKFERGNTDIFELNAVDVGKVKRIKIGHDNKGAAPGWHLNEVIIEKEDGSRYIFPCNRWLDRKEDDGLIERDLSPLEDDRPPEIETDPGVKNYIVDVYTGDVPKAGTDANVYLTIFGSEGETREIRLKESETHSDKFERNHMDRFNITSPYDLGKLMAIRLRHDNTGLLPDWFVDRIEIVERESKDKFLFACKKWLSLTKDEGKIDRIFEEKNYKLSKKKKTDKKQTDVKKYYVKFYANEKQNIDPSANMYIRLFGDFNQSSEQKLRKSQTHKEIFVNDQIDVFVLEEKSDLGTIYAIELKLDDVAKRPKELEHFKLEVFSDGMSYYFSSDNYIEAPNKNYKKIILLEKSAKFF